MFVHASGWEFVDGVMNSKQTFRGFVSCYNNKYERFSLNGGKFMGLQTFFIFLFGWASRIRNDFCKGCFWCKGAPKIIACDGKKIGIGFKNTFVAPIENAEKRAPANVLSPRRLDRCFLRPGNKSDSEQCKIYAAARKVLRNISEAVLNSNLAQVLPETINNLKMLLPTDSVDAYIGMVD